MSINCASCGRLSMVHSTRAPSLLYARSRGSSKRSGYSVRYFLAASTKLSMSRSRRNFICGSPNVTPFAMCMMMPVTPVVKILSAVPFLRTDSIMPKASEIFAPPSTNMHGCSAPSLTDASAAYSSKNWKPAAAGKKCGNPTIDGASRCAAENASLTYKSNSGESLRMCHTVPMSSGFSLTKLENVDSSSPR